MLPFRHILICTLFWALTSSAQAEDYNLPQLNDNTSSIISLQEEYRLGQSWARILRGQSKLMRDPISYQYLEDLIWRLLPNSQVQDRRITMFLLDNGGINAFAVPGGVIGVNGGLLLTTETEGELASVLAHELAHLSQRHYAQRLEEERKNRPMMLAGMLAGILLAAADTEGGMAVISSTMGASAYQQLAFSRRNEQEADRTGMQTLVASGFDPEAMPNMFARLQRSYRFYGQKPPEFLLTHPVTESRIADSMNRAQQLPKPAEDNSSLEFQLIKARMNVHFSNNLRTTIEQLQADIKQDPSFANQYALLLAAIADNQHTLAESTWKSLPTSLQRHIYVKMTRIEQLLASQQYAQAISEADTLLQLYPGNRPIRSLRAEALHLAGQHKLAAQAYRALARDYPNDSEIWYQLSETLGFVDDNLGVHEARIEYFLLTAQFDLALRQIDFAKRDKSLTPSDTYRLEQREREAKALREEMKQMF